MQFVRKLFYYEFLSLWILWIVFVSANVFFKVHVTKCFSNKLLLTFIFYWCFSKECLCCRGFYFVVVPTTTTTASTTTSSNSYNSACLYMVSQNVPKYKCSLTVNYSIAILLRWIFKRIRCFFAITDFCCQARLNVIVSNSEQWYIWYSSKTLGWFND